MTARLTPQTIGIGALAGAATALLCLGMASGSLLAIVLFFISSVPLMLAGLAFGLPTTIVGAIVAVVGSFAFSTGMVAVLVALAIALPACASAYWLNLARPAEEIGGPQGQLAWYPLADVLFAIALMTGFAYIVLGVLTGFGPEVAAFMADELIARFRATNPEISFTQEGAESLQNFLLVTIPVVQPLIWMLALTLSLYLSMAISQRSGLTRRPKEDWTLALRMPRNAIFAFVAAVVGSFMPGAVSYAASSFGGALAAGFLMAGFAMVHARTRGIPGRFLILLLAYLSVLFVAVTAVFFFIAGVFGAGRHVPLTPANPSNPTPRQDD